MRLILTDKVRKITPVVIILGAASLGAAISLAFTHSGAQQGASLKTLRTAISTASHGDLTAVRILPVPSGAAIPDGVTPVEVRSPKLAGKSGTALVWVAQQGGKSIYFPGSAFDTSGTNLAIPLMRDILQTGTLAQVAAAEHAPGFIWATPGHTQDAPNVVLFIDPNCIYCHKEFNQMKPLVDAGKLVVKVVPVAFLKASSMGKAEAILQGGLPAYLQDENSFDDGTEEGGITPISQPSSEQQIRANTQLLSKLEGGRVATPFMLVHGNNGWTPHMGSLSGTALSAKVLGQG